ncbi:hypothetical protein ACS0TY_028403 [Phlomoides rotata]
MFTETSFGENIGGIKVDPSLIDLDLDIGKLSVSFSPPRYPSCTVADGSSVSMVEPDADLLSAFDSICVDEYFDPRDGVAPDIIADAFNPVGLVDLSRQQHDEGNYTCKFDASDDLATIAEASTQGDGEAEFLVDIDKTSRKSHSLIVYTSSGRKSMRSTKSIQNSKSKEPSKSRRMNSKKSVFDFSSLHILRRSRSSKRARSSVWGNLGNILPAIEENGGVNINISNEKKLRRESGGKGKRNVIRDQTDEKSTGRKCTPTGHISLKVRIGNKSCSLGNAFENYSSSGKDIPDLTDTMENKLGEKVLGGVASCERNLKKVMSSDSSALSKHLEVSGTFDSQPSDTSSVSHEIRSLEEGGNLGGSTEIRCSDAGTSPDSEVINSIPDAPHCEKGLTDLQDSLAVSKASVSTTPKHSKKGKKKGKIHQAESRNDANAPISMQNVPSLSAPLTKSKKGKKKDKMCRVGDSSVEAHVDSVVGQKVGDTSYCSDASITRTAKPCLSGAEAKLCSELVTPTVSSNLPVRDPLIPCSNGKKSSKCSRAKGGSKGRSRIFPNEEDKASEKDNKNSVDGRQLVDEEFAAGDDLSRVDGLLQAGNQTPSDNGGIEALNNGLSGPINSLQFSSDGVREQYDPPRNAWVLCDECQKWRRIPATLADQIGETDCGWTCQDNTDKDFADCSIPQEKSNSEINQELEISDGSCEEDAFGTFMLPNQDQLKTAQRSSWSLIKSNLFRNRSRKTQTIDEVMVCHCKPPSDGRMGCGEKCLNRMLNIECVRGTCPCGDLCSNQQFQKCKYAKLKWTRCGKKGHGLQALEDISERQFLIEYVGEVLDVRAYEARQREYAMNGHKHFYFMTLNGSEVIDACAKGNLGRFINHSCDPNCRTEKWMVNGEVCIGLFALRDIKKGDEVTFDYNYVRVFGAAAKKCVCGSPNCRGYIGGDLTNSEEIAQDDSDDEYEEPVMVCEDGDMKEDWNEIMSNMLSNGENGISIESPQNIYSVKKVSSAVGERIADSRTSDSSPQKIGSVNSVQVAKTRVGEGVVVSVGDSSAPHVAEDMNINQIIGEPLKGSMSDALKVETEGLQSKMHLSSRLMDNSDGVLNKAVPSDHKDTVEYKRRLKYANLGGKDELAKSSFVAKTNRSLSSIKKGKPKVNVLNGKASPAVDKSSVTLHKSKKLPELSLNSQVEAAVEGKLNELLDPEGGISKRKDASRGYLKLLFLTAAFGNNGHGEAIQSNRDLSMILDALLKTRSRTVLVDIINKNGLQMLHNIMKRYRKEFIKTPILRKLLKVLEYLATREILTLDHIIGGPPRPGVESFKDSILTLTEHVDRQVYQIARNFRDKWIPRSFRKNSCMERDDGRIEHHQPSSHGGSSASHDHRSDRGATAETSTLDLSASGGGCGTNEPKTRKRKSRWDIPVEPPHSRTRTNSVGDTKLNVDDDIPPGFSSPCNGAMVPINDASTAINHPETEMRIKQQQPSNAILADSQSRFVARMPLSYGVPYSVMQQFGNHQAESPERWAVAPGLAFHQFPPLPVDRLTSTARGASLSEECTDKAGLCTNTCVTIQTDQQYTKTSGINTEGRNFSVANGQPDFQQGGPCNNLGRNYFKQQKLNHVKLAPPWVRMRNGWGYIGNNARNGLPGVGLANGAKDFRNSYNSNEVYRGEF